MPTNQLSPEIINAAIEGFEQQKLHIDGQIAELRGMLPVGSTKLAASPKEPKGKRRQMSAAARKRIGDAQRKRWADLKGRSASRSEPITPETSEPKRRLSAAGRAAIVAALKKRWMQKKAAMKAARTVTKKTALRKVAGKKSSMKTAVKRMAKASEVTRTPQ